MSAAVSAAARVLQEELFQFASMTITTEEAERIALSMIRAYREVRNEHRGPKRQKVPCSDCVDARCTMNCGPAKPIDAK